MLLRPGQTIVGKWSKGNVRIDKHLGTGANGEVYLAKYEGQAVALKISSSAHDIALEWGILERLGKSSRIFPLPILVDDIESPQSAYFYLMEFISGQPFSRVFPTLPESKRQIVLSRVFDALAELHQTGHAFCDVKPENILVDDVTLGVRFIDVGGVTQFGRSVRQFTPLYDRAFWQLGSRLANQSYDMAAVGLLVVCSLKPHLVNSALNWSANERTNGWQNAIADIRPTPLQTLLRNLLVGHIEDASKATEILNRMDFKPTAQVAPNRVPQRRRVRAQGRMDWTEKMMWASLVTAFSAASVAWVSAFH